MLDQVRTYLIERDAVHRLLRLLELMAKGVGEAKEMQTIIDGKVSAEIASGRKDVLKLRYGRLRHVGWGGGLWTWLL